MLPKSLSEHLETTIGVAPLFRKSIYGGSIHKTCEISISGSRYFLKYNRADALSMFRTETEGLILLRQACQNQKAGIQVPQVFKSALTPDETHAWLLMEFLEESQASADSYQQFGHGLAAMHRETSPRFGLNHDNYIGSLPQKNGPFNGTSWSSFFIEFRLQPQFEMAFSSGKLATGLRKTVDKLYRALPEMLPEESPSILHGDLWSGNFMTTGSAGTPSIFDPAVYFGHREVDLAFTRLFGGFPGSFYQAYEEAFPTNPGLSERIGIYNLYPLLVHVNLFGGGYAGDVTRILGRFN